MTESSVVRDVAGVGRRLAEITLEAAAVIRPYWRAGGEVTLKLDSSPVTEADHAGEALIIERLQREFPGVAIVAEEQCADCGPPGSVPSQFFLVDALDGTRGFTRGSEDFTVNIGLIDAGYPVAGAVATPADGRVWFTEGGGAVLRLEDGSERSVRARPRASDAEALVSRSVKPEAVEALGREMGFARWRGVESSLKFCLIAQGEADLYPRTGPTSEWDTAAGQAVLEAAGGAVEAEGGRLRYGKVESRFLNTPFVARGG
ncbi:MAG TPA: 3'(2'),5'-bisphosphate nucleotidase CysQ [Caulobacteraceae bacterium]